MIWIPIGLMSDAELQRASSMDEYFTTSPPPVYITGVGGGGPLMENATIFSYEAMPKQDFHQ